MAYEPFLINPHPRQFRGEDLEGRLLRGEQNMITKHRRRRKLYGAAAEARARKIGRNPRKAKRHRGHRKVGGMMAAWKKYYLSHQKRRRHGGMKPKRARRKSLRASQGLRRGRHRVKGTLTINRPRYHMYDRDMYGKNPLVTLGANPRRRRRYYRNPMSGSLSLAGIDFKRLMPLALTSAGAVMAPGLVVGLLNKYGPLPIDTPVKAYGVQAAVAVGGMMALNKWVGKEYGMIWIVTSAAVVLNSLVQDYVFGFVLGTGARPVAAPATGDVGYEYPTNPTVEIGAYPGDFVGAYPNELQGVGAYPYDGGYPV